MLKDRLIQVTTAISFLAMQAAIWPLILHTKDLPAEVPFWYVLPTAQRLAPVSYLWYLPAIAACFWISNTLIGYLVYRRNTQLAQLLTCLSVIVTLMAAIAIIKTVLIYTPLL